MTFLFFREHHLFLRDAHNTNKLLNHLRLLFFYFCLNLLVNRNNRVFLLLLDSDLSYCLTTLCQHLM